MRKNKSYEILQEGDNNEAKGRLLSDALAPKVFLFTQSLLNDIL
jgi:hypothetical protein